MEEGDRRRQVARLKQQMMEEGGFGGGKGASTTEEFTKPHVFISYVHENSGAVERLCQDLRSYGVTVWIDKDCIDPGERWQDAVRRAIQQEYGFFLACFSQEYSEKNRTFMNKELALAIEELSRRPSDLLWFIPAKLNECEIPDRRIGPDETLRDLQYVDLYRDWEDGLRRIVKATLESPPKRKVARLIESLQWYQKEGLDEGRVRVIDRLGEMGDRTAVPVLTKELMGANDRPKWRDWWSREAAARALGRIGDAATVPALMRVLAERPADECDRSSLDIMRMGIVEALGRIGDPRVVPALTAVLDDDCEQVRRNAVTALGHLGGMATEAVPALARRLADSSQEVRHYAVLALREIGTPDAWTALSQYQREDA